MAIRQLRRIGAPVGDSLTDLIEAQLVHGTYWRRDIDAIEREHPELIVRDGGNIVAAIPQGNTRVIYGFDNERAFVDRFPDMLEALLPRVRKTLAADSVRLRWSYSPGRIVAEHVLKRLWFSPVRDWMEFTLARPPKLPAAPAVKGLRFREGTPDDILEIARIDRQSFPDTPIPHEGFRERLKEESLLIAMSGRDVAGFVTYSQPEPGQGYLAILAVDEAYRGRGIGEALTLRAARALFGAGAQSVLLTTDQDNGNAIRLYVRLGFRQTNAGRDYERPTDPKAIARLKKAGQGTLVRFGGWR